MSLREARSRLRWGTGGGGGEGGEEEGVDFIIDVSLRHEFHGSCVDHMRNGEASTPTARSMPLSK